MAMQSFRWLTAAAILQLRAADFRVNSGKEMRLPPIGVPGANVVNFTMYLSDLKTFDESQEFLTVYAMMVITWEDPRWVNASLRKTDETCSLKNCSVDEYQTALESAAQDLQGMILGQTAGAFFEATKVYGQYLGLLVSGSVWTPIPTDLFIKTSDNPLGKTEFDPVIYMPRPSQLEGIWVDRRTTRFDVTLSHEHYPFDEQTLELCVNFDYWSSPQSVPWSSDGPRLEDLGERWDTESQMSPLVSAKFFASLEAKGFTIIRIKITEKTGGLNGSKICMQIVVVRRITILLLRFFLPLSFLLFIPFAGFFIPIELVMPRVATGFISFLSLQVFRTMAYSLIPKPSSSLLWMDVAMFSVTVIMFVSLLENVLAQVLRAAISSQASRFVDNLSRVTFPLVALLILFLLFAMGAARAETNTTMAVCLALLCIWLVSFSCAVTFYCRYLARMLMKTLVKHVSANSRYNVISFDQKELRVVFEVFDEEDTGSITADKVFQKLQRHGLSLAPEAATVRFQERLRAVFRRLDAAKGELDLKGFGQNFQELFHFDPRPDRAEGSPRAAAEAAAGGSDVAPETALDEEEGTHPFEVIAT